jgi:hypothetical protein
VAADDDALGVGDGPVDAGAELQAASVTSTTRLMG